MKAIRPTKSRHLMATYISIKIRDSGKTQVQISEECGFARPNVVSMIATGRMRLPLDRLGVFAKAIDVDVYELFCWWMREAYGQTWLELESIIARVPTR